MSGRRRVVAGWTAVAFLGAAVASGSWLAAADPLPPPRAVSSPTDLPRLLPTEPAVAAQSFRLRNGFVMQLVAAEPQIASPVAAAYDEDGRLYVVEMRDYPEPTPPGAKPLGRVRRLEDKDGDGRYETATVFADGLPWPTGVACWDGGVFVTAAPDVWYLKDTKGRGIADVRTKVFTGFVVNNVQALVNGLQWGVDNRIYGVTAGNGGVVRRANDPAAKAIPLTGRDFSFDPRTLDLRPEAGTAQFGNTFDDWYHRFVCANRLVAGHPLLPPQALARNPHLPATRMVHDCAAEGSSEALPMFQLSPPEPWRVLRVQRYKEQGQKQPQSEMVATGIFTSGTGVCVYRGAAYPEAYHGNLFVGNVAGNLVHRRTLTPNGATFTATRADEGAEFLASPDNWFRPVNAINAPDGCLHVLDMYREVVEHPWSLPEDIKAALHMTSGRDRGRVWRVAPVGFTPPPPPKIGSATTLDLVAMLANPNAWWRETAQRLITQRQDAAAVEPLRTLSRESGSPLARMHALWALDGLGRLTDDDILSALGSEVPPLREHGLRLADSRVVGHPPLATAAIRCAADPNPQVRFRAALVLGRLDTREAARGLLTIAGTDAGDPWTRMAVLAGTPSRALDVFMYLGGRNGTAPTGDRLMMMGYAAGIVGSKNRPDDVSMLARALLEPRVFAPRVRRTLLLYFGDGLMRNGRTLASVAPPPQSPERKVYDELMATAAREAFRPETPPAERDQALRLLAQAEFATARPAFEAALDPREPQTLQLTAVRAMRTTTAADVPSLLLARWATFTPLVRSEAITTLTARPEWAAKLLDAVEAGTVARAHLDSTRQAVLKAHRDPAVRERATKIFTGATSAQRAAAVTAYRSAAEKLGDPARGLAVFRRECASCHLAGNVGQIVGPAVPTFRDKSPIELLTAVLDPNREVDPRYLNYTVNLIDGRLTSGVVAGESPAAITLRRADAVMETVLRTQIDELKSTAISLMPEEFEKKITLAEMADLIAFLKQ